MSALAGLLLDSSIRSVAVALLVGVVLLVTRSRASDLRHAAWTFALAAMLLMPLLVRWAPDLPAAVPVPISPLSFDLSAVAGEPVSASPDVFASPPAAAVSSVQPPAAPRRSLPSSLTLMQVAGAIWIAGAVALLARLAIGLLVVRRLRKSAERLPIQACAPVFTSPAAIVPVTIGVLRPWIVLPPSWTAWTPARLAAVLAHESAHIRRRDSLVMRLASINQAIFWFHPLAWWLTRKVSATAEDVCDDAGVRAAGTQQAYAQMLLETAGDARRGHGRLAWAALGIHGAGGVRRRIDRVLSGRTDRPASSWRSAAVISACALGLVFVVSCRQKPTVAAELKPDPEVAQRLAVQKATTDLWQSAVKLTEAEVAALEKTVQARPEDLEARKKLLIFYQNSGKKVIGWDRALAAQRPHLLWLIEHRPEDDMSVFQRMSLQYDPGGYAQAKALWLAHVGKPAVTSRIIGNAAYFFENTDKALSEKLLLRARQIDPDGPQPRIENNVYHSPWNRRLGKLYAGAIVGATTAELTGRGIEGSFATHARDVLNESNDPAMLFSAGSQVVWLVSSPRFNFKALGKTYLDRANRLQPGGEAARLLASLDEGDRSGAARKEWNLKRAEVAGGEIARKLRAGEMLTRDEWDRLDDVEVQAVAALSEVDKLVRLPGLALGSYSRGESLDYAGGQAARAKAAWDHSKQFATELLRLAPKFTSDPGYGEAVYSGNIVLSLHALREGDVRTSVAYLKAAGSAPGLALPRQSGLENRLVIYLLKVGERESVAEFLERSAAINPMAKDKFLQDASAIRGGMMPLSYQYMVTPH